MLRIADFVFEKLAEHGAEHVFMVTGRGALFLDDAVEKHQELEPVCTHHEQAAAFAAISYAQASSKTAVCLVSTGCGATNTITAVLSAWQDGVPCVFISGQNTLDETVRYSKEPIRTFGQQEADIIELIEPITKYATFIDNPDLIRYELEKALFLAYEGRPGPVWLDIPLDIQNKRIDPSSLLKFMPEQVNSCEKIDDDLATILQSLNEAKRPVFLIGAGVKLADGSSLLKSYVEKNDIPVVYTSAAPDVYGSSQSHSIGSVGVMGCSRAGAFAVQNADLLIVLGSRLPSSVVGAEVQKFARHAKIIVVDLSIEEYARYGDKISHIFQAAPHQMLKLMSSQPMKAFSNWLQKCQQWKIFFGSLDKWYQDSKAIDLHDLADIFSKVLPGNANFICDSGFVDVIMPTNIQFKLGQKCIHPVYQGAMGFALPGSYGAYLSNKQITVAVIGDGSVMMNLQELQTIAYHRFPVKIIIINNGIYSIIRRRQEELFRKRTIGTDESNGVSVPDFKKIADTFNIPFCQIDKAGRMEEQLSQCLQEDGPMIIEIFGIEKQEYLEVSFARNAQRRFVRRPLEDQYPFIDRQIFAEQMIVPIIDQ